MLEERALDVSRPTGEEALALENLISSGPEYNILLRDDKNYPYSR